MHSKYNPKTYNTVFGTIPESILLDKFFSHDVRTKVQRFQMKAFLPLRGKLLGQWHLQQRSNNDLCLQEIGFVRWEFAAKSSLMNTKGSQPLPHVSQGRKYCHVTFSQMCSRMLYGLIGFSWMFVGSLRKSFVVVAAGGGAGRLGDCSRLASRCISGPVVTENSPKLSLCMRL